MTNTPLIPLEREPIEARRRREIRELAAIVYDIVRARLARRRTGCPLDRDDDDRTMEQ